MSIILIGMPSSGKSTLGVLLAKSLGYRFVDSDLLIQEKTGKLLHEIIAEKGNEGFIRLENEVNQQITDENAVIATGGSVIYRESAMQKLQAMGTVVYLQLSYKEIEKRLGDLEKRGVAIKEGYTLKDLYDERAPLYEKYAHLTVALDGKNIDGSVQMVIDALKKAGKI